MIVNYSFQFGQSSVDVGMGNKTTHSLSEPEDHVTTEHSKLPPSGRASRHRDPTESIEEADDLDVAEVPPPMRPISSIPGPEDSKLRVIMHVIEDFTLRRSPSSSCHLTLVPPVRL